MGRDRRQRGNAYDAGFAPQKPRRLRAVRSARQVPQVMGPTEDPAGASPGDFTAAAPGRHDSDPDP